MKTYECVVHNGKNGDQIVIFVRALTAIDADVKAREQARVQFGSNAGNISVVSIREV